MCNELLLEEQQLSILPVMDGHVAAHGMKKRLWQIVDRQQ